MGLYDNLDDETFLAATKLNAPEAFELAKAGNFTGCGCGDCERLKRLLAQPDPSPAYGKSPGIAFAENAAALRAELDKATTRAILGVDPAAGDDATVVFVNGQEGDSLTVEKLLDAKRWLEDQDAPDRRLLDAIFGAASEITFQTPAGFEEFLKEVVEDDATNVYDDSAERKATPVATGVLAYFPNAIREVAKVSRLANEKHNPGEPVHWARGKSTDEPDALARHLLDYLEGKDYDVIYNPQGVAIGEVPVLAELAWRALALLERWSDGENPGRI